MLEIVLSKDVLLGILFFIVIVYQLLFVFVLLKNRNTINFVSAFTKPDGTISKSSIFFFILMQIIIYQSLFMGKITEGLVELMGVIIAGDIGQKVVDHYKDIQITKIQKTNENTTKLSDDDFKNL